MTFKNVKTEDIVKFYTQDGLTMRAIGERLRVSHWTVLDRLKKAGVRKNTRHKVIHNVFSSFTPSSCYWAGFIAADGCLRSNGVEVELAECDKKHLHKLCKFGGRDNKLWNREKYGHKSASMSLVSKQIAKDLKNNFSICKNKSLILSPPNLPKHLISHYIRGYMDGDGSIGWHKHCKSIRLCFTSGSSDILNWIKTTVVKKVSTSGSPSVRHKNNNCYYLEFKNKNTIDILNWLYLDSTPNTRLTRKYKKYLELKKLYLIGDTNNGRSFTT